MFVLGFRILSLHTVSNKKFLNYYFHFFIYPSLLITENLETKNPKTNVVTIRTTLQLFTAP